MFVSKGTVNSIKMMSFLLESMKAFVGWGLLLGDSPAIDGFTFEVGKNLLTIEEVWLDGHEKTAQNAVMPP